MSKTITTKRGSYIFKWRNESIPHRTIAVDVYHENETTPFMEWIYGRMHGSLAASVSVWQDQALLQAKAEDDDA